ncbi:MAG: DUF4179 domain-containing protein [Geodermatophilaceae bacterium]|nr:DUF4179 domain-containing protein [Geodermatophilaceae bacterium]
MNTATTFERRLEQALIIDPQVSTLRALDERIARAIARVPEARSSRWSLRRASRPGLAFVLVVVLAGGAVAGSGILTRVAESVPAFAIAWERATPIDQSKTVDGRTVTVERAYVDANLILVGLTLRDRSGEPAEVGRVEVRVDGVGDAPDMLGVGDMNRVETAEVLTFQTPVGVGDDPGITLVVRDLPATFRFEVPNAGGRTVDPDLRTTASGVSVTLERLTISPTVISGRLALAGGPIEIGEAWGPFGSIVAGDTDTDISLVQPYTDDQPFVTFHTTEGSASPSGTWTIRIDEIVGHEDGEQIRLAGPWVFEVAIP